MLCIALLFVCCHVKIAVNHRTIKLLTWEWSNNVWLCKNSTRQKFFIETVILRLENNNPLQPLTYNSHILSLRWLQNKCENDLATQSIFKGFSLKDQHHKYICTTYYPIPSLRSHPSNCLSGSVFYLQATYASLEFDVWLPDFRLAISAPIQREGNIV